MSEQALQLMRLGAPLVSTRGIYLSVCVGGAALAIQGLRESWTTRSEWQRSKAEPGEWRVVHYNSWYLSSCILGSYVTIYRLVGSCRALLLDLGDAVSYLWLIAGASVRLWHDVDLVAGSRDQGSQRIAIDGISCAMEIVGALLVLVGEGGRISTSLAITVPVIRIGNRFLLENEQSKDAP